MTDHADQLTPYIDDGDQRIYAGDCREVMAAMPADSVHVIVTDPPYGLEFMGREWDKFRIDDRSARWGSRSGEAGGFHDGGMTGILPSYGSRRTTSRCRTCNKRDAFRNPHACDDLPEGADWIREYVDVVPVEMRAFQNWTSTWAAEAYRVLKPGGHVFAFGGTRTYHRMTCGLEDVGFEIRDCLMWLYGSGFPKSMDTAQAIDKAAGVDIKAPERWRLEAGRQVYVPATDEAKRWHGWGTALKPAWEPIVMARKPLIGSVAANLADSDTGALNVDACRIAVDPADPVNDAQWTSRPSSFRDGTTGFVTSNADGDTRSAAPPAGGRWPANLVLTHHPECEQVGTLALDSDGHYPSARPASSTTGGPDGHAGQSDLAEGHTAGELVPVYDCHVDCPVSELDRQSGPAGAQHPVTGQEPSNQDGYQGNTYGKRSGARPAPLHDADNCHADCPVRQLDEQAGDRASGWRDTDRGPQGEGSTPFFTGEYTGTHFADAGGASRFFYTAKASRGERNEGIHGLPDRQANRYSPKGQGPLPQQTPTTGTVERNHHPTVKPVALMRWLIRLAAAPDAVILDPFLGSGTTLVAARAEHRRGVGIELDPEFLPIAAGRLSQLSLFSLEADEEAP